MKGKKHSSAQFAYVLSVISASYDYELVSTKDQHERATAEKTDSRD